MHALNAPSPCAAHQENAAESTQSTQHTHKKQRCKSRLDSNLTVDACSIDISVKASELTSQKNMDAYNEAKQYINL